MRTINLITILALTMLFSCNKESLEPDLRGTWKAESSERTFLYEFGEKEMKVYTVDCKLISEASYYTSNGTLYKTPYTPLDYEFEGTFKGSLTLHHRSGETFIFTRTGFCLTR